MPANKKRSYRGKRSSNTKFKYSKKGSSKSSKSNQKIAKVVKGVLSKQVETKCIQLSNSLNVKNIQLGTTQADLNSQVQCLTPFGASGLSSQNAPIIGNGTGQDQRIGDEIRIKGIYVDYLLTALGYNATTNTAPKSYVCEVWIIQAKVGSNVNLDVSRIQAGSALADFFENQTNNDSGFSGITVDMLRRVDRDNWKVIAKRTHKIGYTGTLNASNVVATLGNNDFHQFAKGRIKIPAFTMKWDRIEYPQNQPMYFFVQIMNADGTSLATTQVPVTCVMNETIYYTDM